MSAPIPDFLSRRFENWRLSLSEQEVDRYTQLMAEGQAPKVMLITCCDSRIDPTAMFLAEPGEIFMVRNVANLVPPFHPDHMHHGTSAAVEYAVKVLKVRHIVIMGHAKCGGVAAYYDAAQTAKTEAIEAGDFISNWMSVLAPAYKHICDMEGPRDARLRNLEQQGVLLSMGNLRDFPFVAAAMAAGKLELHGCWFDIAAGQLAAYNPQSGVFETLAMEA